MLLKQLITKKTERDEIEKKCKFDYIDYIHNSVLPLVGGQDGL